MADKVAVFERDGVRVFADGSWDRNGGVDDYAAASVLASVVAEALEAINGAGGWRDVLFVEGVLRRQGVKPEAP